MRNNTKDMMKAVQRGIRTGAIACALVMVFAFSSGDAAKVNEAGITSGAEHGAVAGVLLSPRTRLIIDYKRSALA